METQEDREFLDLLEKEESGNPNAIRIPEEMTPSPEKLDWRIKFTILFIITSVGILSLLTYKILNPSPKEEPRRNASP
jgi:hypothetical protein